jgi:hypothetical protein
MANTMSVEIKSKNHVKNIVVSNDAHDKVLFVAELGELLELSFVDDEVLQYVGTNGTLRVDLRRETLYKLLESQSAIPPSSEYGSSKHQKGEET